MHFTLFRSLFRQSNVTGLHYRNVARIGYNQTTQFRTTNYTKEVKTLKEFSQPESIFCRAKHGPFHQESPRLVNVFLTDVPLQSFLRHHVPVQVTEEISGDLQSFGDRIVNEINDLGWECELNQPSLEAEDVWGRRVDELKTCQAWKRMHDITAEEGLVAIPYEQKLNYWSRLHQICKLYLYAPSSGLYSCPVAMTDGAAKTIKMKNISVNGVQRAIFDNAFNHLTSRDHREFWTSGQWMTERRGGSDVATSTETIAVPENGFYRLYGYKWFSSATDSNVALTLARISQTPDTTQEMNEPTLFYVETKTSQGQFNNLQIVKLKNKLGTRGLPTAELLLDGCVAHKLSDEGRGIASISHMLNITRLHNAVSSVALMRRMLMLSRDYSQKRKAFGKKLAEIPLHMRVLSQMEVEVAILLGKSEEGVSTADDTLLLRLMSPVLKLYTAKQCIAVASEGLETFGGQGYMEDSRLPVILRDAQVCSIWEGTTNVMSIDVIRSLIKTNFEALLSFKKNGMQCLERGKEESALRESCMKVEKSITYIVQFVETPPDLLNIAARDLSFSIAKSYIGALLIENAAVTKEATDLFTAKQWCEVQELCPLSLRQNYSDYVENDREAVMEGWTVG